MMKVKKIPQRKCLGCNEMKDKKALLRVVRSPEGEVSLDLTGKKNGRGAYVCPDKECITKAVKEKRLERALEKPIGEDVLKQLLEDFENVAFALGLAQKAGKTASGDVAVRAALKSGKVKVLVLAQDAAPNSKKEIYFLAEMAGVQVIELLTRNELGHAIGKGPRIAVAITDANFANMLLKK